MISLHGYEIVGITALGVIFGWAAKVVHTWIQNKIP
jgi:hypothetical protein